MNFELRNFALAHISSIGNDCLHWTTCADVAKRPGTMVAGLCLSGQPTGRFDRLRGDPS